MHQAQALLSCEARIVAALDYLQSGPDRERAIALAETQLIAARIAIAAERMRPVQPVPARRADDLVALTFNAADRVPVNPWPPAPRRTA